MLSDEQIEEYRIRNAGITGSYELCDQAKAANEMAPSKESFAMAHRALLMQLEQVRSELDNREANIAAAIKALRGEAR